MYPLPSQLNRTYETKEDDISQEEEEYDEEEDEGDFAAGNTDLK